MSAQDLFQQGVSAIRDDKDPIKARDLLTQALRLDPTNDMAWVWLSRTVSDSEKKKQCIERALKINPRNEQARKLMGRLAAGLSTSTNEMAVVSAVEAQPKRATASLPTQADPGKAVSSANEMQIKALLAKAKTYLDQEKTESAIEQWVRVLEIVPDHEAALGNAVRYLSRLKYMDDAKELVWNALKSGTEHPSVYLTAIDIARLEDDPEEANKLREKLISLPAATEDMVVENVDYFLKNHYLQEASKALEKAVQNYPKSQRLMVRMGNCLEDLGRHQEAIPYFDRAARLGAKTSEGRLAEGKLDAFAPTVTDRERGSVLLAVREAVGIGVFVLVLGWLDSGLNLLQMGLAHWIGVVLGLVGGYLVVTATSSPQQKPLASLLGGELPAPEEPEKDEFGNPIIKEVSQLPIMSPAVRSILGLVGVVVVGVAFYMVFSRTIQLLGNPNPPQYYVPTYNEFLAQISK